MLLSSTNSRNFVVLFILAIPCTPSSSSSSLSKLSKYVEIPHFTGGAFTPAETILSQHKKSIRFHIIQMYTEGEATKTIGCRGKCVLEI